MFKWKASPSSASSHSRKDGGRLKTETKSSEPPARKTILSSDFSVEESSLRLHRDRWSTDPEKEQGKTKQNKTNRTESGEPTRLLSSAAAGPGSAPARDPRIPRPSPRRIISFEQPQAESQVQPPCAQAQQQIR